MKSLVLFFGLAFLLCGCGDSDGKRFVSECEDLASAIADASFRCGAVDRETPYQEFINSDKIGGSCNNVVGVRDIDALYDECIPALSTVECDAFSRGNYTSTCSQQLIIDR